MYGKNYKHKKQHPIKKQNKQDAGKKQYAQQEHMKHNSKQDTIKKQAKRSSIKKQAIRSRILNIKKHYNMNPLDFIKNFRIRYKLLFIYSVTFILTMGLASLILYTIVKSTVEKNIESELQNSTTAILNNVKTAVSVSIKNHMRATAEKNYEIIQHLYSLQQKGEITLEEAKERASDIILCQKVGVTGYLCILDGKGKVLKHPQKLLEGLDISDHKFVKQMIAMKTGYIEYFWKNPDDLSPQPKALYINYFEPWDWLITVSSYRKEFERLVNISDFKESISSQRLGKTGYSYVMDTKGNIIIHPELEGVNVFSDKRFSSNFYNQMLKQKNGKFIYEWKNPNDEHFRKKLVIFNTIPEYEWIVASANYLDEFYSPLNIIRNIIIIMGIASLIIFIPVTFMLSSTITKPLRELMSRFNQEIHDGFSDRLVSMQSDDEVGQLAFYYNTFMEKLERYNRTLQAEIVERKLAQEALELSEEKYRSLMDATPDPIIVYNMEGEVTYLNPAFTRVFGYTFEESAGYRMDNFVPEEHWQEAMNAVGMILKGEPVAITETIRRAKSGKLIDVSIIGSVYRDKYGRPAGIVVTHRDISDVKFLEKSIMETGERERQKIGNDLHDDLCPHLIGIEGLTKVLKRKVQGYSYDAGNLSDKITELIKEAISKTRRLARGLCPAYFDYGLESSLRELVNNINLIHQVDCTLESRETVDVRNPMIVINLYHIVGEAVQNAIRHGKAAKIVIVLDIEDGNLNLSVRDNGIGMDSSMETKGMGIRIMSYRAKLIGASFTIQSNNNNIDDEKYSQISSNVQSDRDDREITKAQLVREQGTSVMLTLPFDTLCNELRSK
ncbi:MAG: cache domain-containing protein [Desulfamplus sp.]|nr:cache domain-containing protein [Desulfamplus sp.]